MKFKNTIELYNNLEDKGYYIKIIYNRDNHVLFYIDDYKSNDLFIVHSDNIKLRYKKTENIVKNIVCKLPSSLQSIFYDYILKSDFTYNNILKLTHKIDSSSSEYSDTKCIYIKINYKSQDNNINKLLYHYH
jgi:hypothetical protein